MISYTFQDTSNTQASIGNTLRKRMNNMNNKEIFKSKLMAILHLEKSKLLIITKGMNSMSIHKEAETIKVNNQLKIRTYF